MEHKTTITPLNCAFGTGLNAILRMERWQYDADTVRSIYCKDPDISWFRMKAGTATPYIEPAFYKLDFGDIIEVEFEALAVSGDVVIDARLIPFTSAYNSGAFNKNIATDKLQSYFKKYKSRLTVPVHGGTGVVLNLRPSDESLNSEIIIKNIEIKVITNNPYFSMVNNITAYRTVTDFKKCADYYSGTNVNPGYNGLLSLVTGGQISFPDNETFQVTNAGTTNFKGLMTLFNGHKYRACVAVYAEYISPFHMPVTVKNVKEDGTVTQEASGALASSTTLRKGITYLNGGVDPSRKTFVDIGTVGTAGDFTLKNVRFSMPQFDDSVKRSPNQLEELYTNLNAKLR